jgi:(1->4)-alpha-D-glucan 1-alpha-D-glucosylmutase
MRTQGSSGAAGRKKLVPLATYRLQFNANFRFGQACEISSYLAELGISDIYASPLFQAGLQSTHGYDVCCYDQISPALGGREGFEQLSRVLRDRRLGLLLDMVPNHMGNDQTNRWWLDVLENGRSSPHALWFDINWESSVPGLRGKVLLPILEAPYWAVLESGKLKVMLDGPHLAIAYYDRKFPASARSYLEILRRVADALPDSELAHKTRALLADARHLESSTPHDKNRFKGLKAAFAKLHAGPDIWRATLQNVLDELNGHPGQPRSFDGLNSLLDDQHYRFAFWRIGPEIINYRRFFDVTELVSMRVECKEVFEASHRLAGDLIRDGIVTGLRIDHPDGLWNPKEYCERLQATFGGNSRLFVVVEKILTEDELLPADWPVDGTTGYDFLNWLNGLFVNRDAEGEFSRIYSSFTGENPSFETAVYAGKEKVLHSSFTSETTYLGELLEKLAAASRYSRDLTSAALLSAVAEMLVAFPVYRTYVTPDCSHVSATDRSHVETALEKASKRKPSLSAACEFIRDLLTLRFPSDYGAAAKRRAFEFVMRFQQLSGPVMAKGLEDTALYSFNRLVSLNEVGGDPAQFGVTIEKLHEHNIQKMERWPHSLLATATHDTKRGEDVRARINVLSEIPQEWRHALQRWAGLNAVCKTVVDGRPAPLANDEYLLYQTLLGAWPEGAQSEAGLAAFRERVSAYMVKAAKEAKAQTSWTEPNAEYEEALKRFVEELLREPQSPFILDFVQLQRKVAWFGLLNSLSQVLLKFTCPGIPDLYQGTELWDFSLVDPDNRRPVDYALRTEMLHAIRHQLRSAPAGALASELLRDWPSGAIKLFLIMRLLAFRHANRELFEEGAYVPLSASGPQCGHVCAFARTGEERQAIVIAPRLMATLLSGQLKLPVGNETWSDTMLTVRSVSPAKQLQNVLTDESVQVSEEGRLRVGDVLKTLPVALLATS